MSTLLLPLALGVVMLSLGLALTLDDFRRVARFQRAVIIALVCQTLVLPIACAGLCWAFGLSPELSVGLMLLAASPGGVIANVFSHLANGDLALNITLTAINSALSILTLPLILGVSLAVFMQEGRVIPPQFSKIVQVFVIVLGPVALGMVIRARATEWARRLDKPVKVFALLFLVFAAAMAIIKAWDTMVQYFAVLGAAVISFNILSLLTGYAVPRLLRVGQGQSIAISMEIGLHNGALALAIALSPMMLNNAAMAVPPALYGVLSPFFAAGFAVIVNRLSNPAS
jgi:BASS family bile acid:Na+ symporter